MADRLWAPARAQVEERKAKLETQARKIIGWASASMGGEGATFRDLGAMQRIVDQLHERAVARVRFQEREQDKLANTDRIAERATTAIELWCVQEWEVLLGMVKTGLFEAQGRGPPPPPGREKEEAARP